MLGFGSNWLLNTDLLVLIRQPMEDLFFDLRDDKIMKIELAYYF